jgi:hypothetical protein
LRCSTARQEAVPCVEGYEAMDDRRAIKSLVRVAAA